MVMSVRSPETVLICVENLAPRRDRRVWREACALRDAGYRVVLAGPTAPGDPHRQTVDDIELVTYRAAPELSSVLGFVYEYGYSFCRTAAIVWQVSRRHRLSAVQVCNPPDIFFPLAWALRRRGIRFVFDHHDLVPELFRTRFGTRLRWLGRVLEACERATVRAADRVISTNESYRSLASARNGQPEAKFTVVRNGPELATMYPRDERPQLKAGRAHLVVWFGNMGPSDGLDGALDTVAELVVDRRRSDTQFAFVGRGEVLEAMRERAVELGVDHVVSFPGWVDDDTAFAYLSTADIGFSADPPGPLNDLSTMNKTLEYMAFGLPVAAYDLPETRVSAGDAALYADGGPTAMADVIEELLDDDELRQILGKRGRARIENDLAWDHQKHRYVATFDELLGRSESDRGRRREDRKPAAQKFGHRDVAGEERGRST